MSVSKDQTTTPPDHLGMGIAEAELRFGAIPSWGDLFWSITGGLLLFGLIILGEFFPAAGPFTALLRVPLGLAYVLFVPGYLLQAILFPRWGDLDGIERTGLSLGLSVALVPLLALLLDRLPWGLSLWGVVVGQVLLVEILALGATIRRFSLPPWVTYAPDLHPRPGLWWRGLPTADRRLFLFAGSVLFFALAAVAWVFLVPSDSEFMTEFYILGPEGLAENFPRSAAPGETLSVTIGFTNLERDDHTYRVEVWAVDPWTEGRRQMTGEIKPFALEVGNSLEVPLNWVMPWPGQDQNVEFLLYIDGQTEPYRRLLLWLNVEPDDG